MHALGALDAVGIVDDVRDAMGAAQGGHALDVVARPRSETARRRKNASDLVGWRRLQKLRHGPQIRPGRFQKLPLATCFGRYLLVLFCFMTTPF